MQPVLALARELDITKNPDPRAIYEVGTAGFQIWCTPQDHPEGWDDIQMDKGAFSKACGYVASVGCGWNEDAIVCVRISTDAYALRDLHGGEYSLWRNRPEDIEWAKQKIAWLFEQSDIALPPIEIAN
jgi:hypothetical protein